MFTHWLNVGGKRLRAGIIRFTFTANGKSLDSGWPLLKLENDHIKTVKNYYYGWNRHETFSVDAINIKRRKKGNLVTWYKLTVAVFCKRDFKSLFSWFFFTGSLKIIFTLVNFYHNSCVSSSRLYTLSVNNWQFPRGGRPVVQFLERIFRAWRNR